MEERRPPERAIWAAVWAAVLTPLTRLLPGAAARGAGAAGWLALPLALPAAMALTALPDRIVRREEDGLAPAILRLLGRPVAAVVYAIYIVWAAILAAARFRLSGEYFLAAVGQRDRLWVTVLPAAALAAWLAAKQSGAVVRAGALTARVVGAGLAGWVVLAAFRVRTERLLPICAEDLPSVAGGAALALGLMCAGVYGTFFGWRPGKRRSAGAAVRWAALVAAQVCLFGGLGAELTARTEDPFITLSRSVGVDGAIQRVESLAAAMGLLGDLIMAALLLGASRRLLGQLRPSWGGGKSAAILAAADVVLALTLFRQEQSAVRFGLGVAPAGNLILGLALPVGLYLLEHKRRGLKTGGHIL